MLIKKSLSSILIGLSLCSPIIHAAENCATVDLRSRFPAPKFQGNQGNCYAFAVSDALSFELGIKPPDTVSAFDVHANYISSKPSDLISNRNRVHIEHGKRGNYLGGIPDYLGTDKTGVPILERQFGFPEIAAANLIKRGHLCLESQVPSQSLKYGELNSIEASFIQRRMLGLLGTPIDEREPRSFPEPLRLCPEPRVPEFRDIAELHPAVHDWAAAKLNFETAKQCSKPIPIGKMEVKKWAFDGSNEDHRESLKTMNLILDKHHPFILTYNSCLVQGCPDTDFEEHVSTVVGRRRNAQSGECEILIRDSFGPTCKISTANVSCDAGYWSVPMSKITSSAHGIVEISKPQPQTAARKTSTTTN